MSKNIKILGTGCAKCKALEQRVREYVKEAGMEAEISKVEDIVDIMGYGIMRTPGLVVDEKVVLSGRLPSYEELKNLLA
ncbi:MAG: thioredoxin family protein [Bacteroidia bacterium]|jgi:small redox-active disulfide protein 2|nr:thioredoxin family protein [Bacteroidia bacterium]